MRKVLIIGHFGPYRRGGSIRVFALAKYLLEFGWQPVILTGSLDKRPDPKFKVIEVPFKDIFDFWKIILKKIGFNSTKSLSTDIKERLEIKSKYSIVDFFISFYSEIFGFPDVFKNWEKPAIKATDDFLKKEKIDAIISVWPTTSHLIAEELKIRYKIPWIADFPDLWSFNCDYKYSFIRKIMDRRLEIKTLQLADALVVLSKYDKETQERLHRGKSIYVIPHGFDSDEMVDNFQSKLDSNFTITYAGTLYSGKRDPSKIFSAIKELILEGNINPNDIEIRFYGPQEEWLEKEIKKYNLFSIVKQYGVVPREIVLEKQRKSQILLLLKWEDIKEKGVYSGKIFEYLASKRPILATGGGRDVISDLLNETKAGIDALTVEDMKTALKSFYYEYKKKGKVSFYGDIEKISGYNSKEMAKKFTDILNKITKS